MIESWGEVDRALLVLGRAQIESNQLEATINAQIQRIQERYAEKVKQLTEAVQGLTGMLETWMVAHEKEVEGSTYKCAWGKVSYKLNPEKIVLIRGKKEGKVAQELREEGRIDAVRMVVMLDKQSILKNGLDQELMRKGIRVVRRQTFSAKPDLKTIAAEGLTAEAKAVAS